jgi:hypothetical protein
MRSKHRPRPGQVAQLTLTPSDLCDDMRTVASAVGFLRGPSSSGDTVTTQVIVTLGTATAGAVVATHTWTETTAALAERSGGKYTFWAVGTAANNVQVQSNPYAWTCISDHETETD